MHAARWNVQAETESAVSPFAGFTTHSFSALRREESESEGRQEECGSELVINGETEGGGSVIRVDEKGLSFNGGEDKESVSAGGVENV